MINDIIKHMKEYMKTKETPPAPTATEVVVVPTMEVMAQPYELLPRFLATIKGGYTVVVFGVSLNSGGLSVVYQIPKNIDDDGDKADLLARVRESTSRDIAVFWYSYLQWEDMCKSLLKQVSTHESVLKLRLDLEKRRAEERERTRPSPTRVYMPPTDIFESHDGRRVAFPSLRVQDYGQLDNTDQAQMERERERETRRLESLYGHQVARASSGRITRRTVNQIEETTRMLRAYGAASAIMPSQHTWNTVVMQQDSQITANTTNLQ